MLFSDSIPPLLAITFGSPLLLWGLLLGAIPIVVHLLNRRRYRETRWAAMRFLLAAARKNSRRMRIEQLLLLAVRTLLVVLLVLALAEPFAAGLGALSAGRAPVHRVIVVDASYSMATRDGEATRFERARRIARELAEDARDGDALNLVVVRDGDPRAIVREPSYRTDVVVQEIDRLRVTDEAGDLAGTLDEVVEVLEGPNEIDAKEVVVLTDLRRRDWQPADRETRRRLTEAIDAVGDLAELRVVDVSRNDVPNVTILDVGTEEPFRTLGEPIGVRAKLVNRGPEPLEEFPVECLVDGRLADRALVALPVGEPVAVSFTTTPESPGEHVIEIRTPPDALPVDDRRWLVVDVREAVNVLLVDGDPSGRPMQGATDFLQLALGPGDEYGEAGRVRQRVVTEGELPGVDLTRYDCVFVCNVGLFTEREAAILRTYVESGGGLVISLGDRVQAESYNRLLFAEGRGILPAAIVDRRITPPDGEGFEFAAEDLSHPLVHAFAGNPNSGLATTRVVAYAVVRPAENAPAEVALRYANGDPAIVERPFGAGRCVMITTSLDRDWGGPWPGWPSFPQLMQETVAFAVAGGADDDGLQVGEPFSQAFPAGVVGASASVAAPDGSTGRAALTPWNGLARLTFAETFEAGPYEVELGPPLATTTRFAVNVDPDEGRLTPLDRAAMPGELAAVAATDAGLAIRTGTPTSPAGNPLRDWLLSAVLCLLLVESLMAWRFAWGFALLCGLVASVLITRGALAAPVLTGVLLALVAIGCAAAWRFRPAKPRV